MKLKTVLLAILLIFNLQIVESQNKKQNAKFNIEAKQIEKLKNDIESIINVPELNSALVGISIRSLDSNEIIFQQLENKNFVPASVQKLFTTANALEVLGADYRYSASLYLDGTIKDNGKFEGNIIIKGNGDPSLSKRFYSNPSEYLEKWACMLDSLGIRMITGNIIGDDRFFDYQLYGSGWAWDDVNYSFSAPIGALSFNQNQTTFTFKPHSKIGERAFYEFKPSNDYIRVINNVSTIQGKQNNLISVSRDFNSNLFDFSGYISQDSLTNANGYMINVAIDNPTLNFLHQFKRELENRSIKFRGALLSVEDLVDKPNYQNFTPLFENQSLPLIEILKATNKFSDNFLAEMTLKTIAKESSGIGSFQKGAEILRNFALKSGAKPENINFVDGSGLSRMNFCSPSAVTALLAYMFKSPHYQNFSQTLANPNENGTLKNRMNNSLAENNLKAKTGSMNGVSSLAGYVKTRDGENLAFSIMIMNFSSPQNFVSNIQDMICMRLAGFSRKK